MDYKCQYFGVFQLLFLLMLKTRNFIFPLTEKTKKLREENSGHLIEPCILTDV